MAEASTASERYLNELASLLTGSTRARLRLREEIASHIDDARSQGASEERALLQLGEAQHVARAWAARCARKRALQRRRVAALAGAVAVSCLLAVTQYARGGQPLQTTTRQPAQTTDIVHSRPTRTRAGCSAADGKRHANEHQIHKRGHRPDPRRCA